VRCLSPDAQVQCHAQGYAPDEADLQDLKRLLRRRGRFREREMTQWIALRALDIHFHSLPHSDPLRQLAGCPLGLIGELTPVLWRD
jgi:hypothetical protein